MPHQGGFHLTSGLPGATRGRRMCTGQPKDVPHPGLKRVSYTGTIGGRGGGHKLKPPLKMSYFKKVTLIAPWKMSYINKVTYSIPCYRCHTLTKLHKPPWKMSYINKVTYSTLEDVIH
jgi:hypothetical protein